MEQLNVNGISHLSENVLRALNQNRITTLADFLQEEISKVATITKLSLAQIVGMRNEIFAKHSAPVVNGTTLFVKCLGNQQYLRTGIERLDTALEGGIPNGYLTEICGLADSGKTQICHQLAINTAISNYSVLYIDTKGDFSAVRIQKILDAAGLTHKEMANIMCKIRVVHIWTMEDIIKLLKQLTEKIIEIKNLALIIIDSIPSLMLQFLGDENKTGLKFLNIMVNYCRTLMQGLNIAIICVNIQTRWIEQDVADLEDECNMKETCNEKRNRCLGKYWKHIPFLILILEKSQQNQIVDVSILKSTEDAYNICCLNITDFGIR